MSPWLRSRTSFNPANVDPRGADVAACDRAAQGARERRVHGMSCNRFLHGDSVWVELNLGLTDWEVGDLVEYMKSL